MSNLEILGLAILILIALWLVDRVFFFPRCWWCGKKVDFEQTAETDCPHCGRYSLPDKWWAE